MATDEVSTITVMFSTHGCYLLYCTYMGPDSTIGQTFSHRQIVRQEHSQVPGPPPRQLITSILPTFAIGRVSMVIQNPKYLINCIITELSLKFHQNLLIIC